ncbi:hypothetical protein EV424DRAFT_1642193 [Suillus variegatus]|nr:hypothetical protein EV424DRAFT_1642193 [Suillus variegatus]
MYDVAVENMGMVGGWSVLRMCSEESEIRVHRKPAKHAPPNLSLSPGHSPAKHQPPHLSNRTPNPRNFPSFNALLSIFFEEGKEERSLSLLNALMISALIEPVPFSVDGEAEKDEGLQENIVRCAETQSCGAHERDWIDE